MVTRSVFGGYRKSAKAERGLLKAYSSFKLGELGFWGEQGWWILTDGFTCYGIRGSRVMCAWPPRHG